jgi:hypothetical protein
VLDRWFYSAHNSVPIKVGIVYFMYGIGAISTLSILKTSTKLLKSTNYNRVKFNHDNIRNNVKSESILIKMSPIKYRAHC